MSKMRELLNKLDAIRNNENAYHPSWEFDVLREIADEARKQEDYTDELVDTFPPPEVTILGGP